MKSEECQGCIHSQSGMRCRLFGYVATRCNCKGCPAHPIVSCGGFETIGGQRAIPGSERIAALEAQVKALTKERERTCSTCLKSYDALAPCPVCVDKRNALIAQLMAKVTGLEAMREALANEAVYWKENYAALEAQAVRLQKTLSKPPIVVMQSQAVLQEENTRLRQQLAAYEERQCGNCGYFQPYKEPNPYQGALDALRTENAKLRA